MLVLASTAHLFIFNFLLSAHNTRNILARAFYSLDLCHRSGVKKMAAPAPIINPCIGIFDLNFLWGKNDPKKASLIFSPKTRLGLEIEYSFGTCRDRLLLLSNKNWGGMSSKLGWGDLEHFLLKSDLMLIFNFIQNFYTELPLCKKNHPRSLHLSEQLSPGTEFFSQFLLWCILELLKRTNHTISFLY